MDTNVDISNLADIRRTQSEWKQTQGKPLAWRAWITAILILVLAGTLAACSGTSGNGGDANEPPDEPPTSPQSLKFTYPYNGQQDVPLGTQIVATFASAVTSNTDAFALVSASGQTQPISVTQDSNQQNIYRIQPVAQPSSGNPVKLAPETTYKVQLNGKTKFRFTTRPTPTRPAGAQGFKVVARTPGTSNPVTGVTLPFTEFNTIRLVLSAPVDESTVQKGVTFLFKDGSGQTVKGNLTALGHYISFDPKKDLTADKTYTLTLTTGVESAFGAALNHKYTDTLTPLDTGRESTLRAAVRPSGSLSSLPDNPLSGTPTNLAVIDSFLIGVNKSPTVKPQPLGGVKTILAEGNQALFGNINPGIIPAGQRVGLKNVDLKLSGTVDTPITSGTVVSTFINDADVYLLPNQLRKGDAPTAVRLRFDLAISTLASAPPGTRQNITQSIANGLFTQTIMNIQAAGTVDVRSNGGDLVINAVGSFPINVNRVGTATIDLELRMVLANDNSDTPVPTITPDKQPPIATAVFPSSCLYLFGKSVYGSTFSGHPVTPAMPEKVCAGALSANGGTSPYVNNFPVESSPFIQFSEPVDPGTVTHESLTLLKNGTTPVETINPKSDDVALRVEGATVVIDPQTRLEPDTQYTIAVNRNGIIKDRAGNKARFGRLKSGGRSLAAFRTEALQPSTDTPPFIASIVPGLPCALDGGDFMNGGNVAGNCVGDNPDKTPNLTYEVFELPANQTVDIFLNKFVKADSVTYANGCLTGGGQAATSGTIAIQHMNGSGQCQGVVDGKLIATNAGAREISSFSFRPTTGFTPGERYWIVICGTMDGMCSTNRTIKTSNDGAINTDPLNNAKNAGVQGAGGPTYVMPFDAVEASPAFYVTQFNAPIADTNGDGFLNEYETPQPGNSVISHALGSGHTGYLSLYRPLVIHDQIRQCDAVMKVKLPSGQPAVGKKPEQCIPVSLLPGGFTMITALLSGGVLGTGTGPLLLRYPAIDGPDKNNYVEKPQTGYIVEQCSGTFQGKKYHYSPCFVANLTQTVNAPDATTVLSLQEQQFNVQLFGPVTFEQNGRLVISLINTNTFALDALQPATTKPGELHFQLSEPPSHGGRAFVFQ